MFQPFEENKEALIKEMQEFIAKTKSKDKYKTEEDVKRLLSEILSGLMLTVYDLTAQFTTNERTIQALDDFNYTADTSHFIQNIMMHEQLKRFSQYVKRSDELFDKTQSLYVKRLLRKVFRKHCFENEIQYVGEGQKYIDKYLPMPTNKKRNIVALRLMSKHKK